MIWACFAATGPGHPAVLESTKSSFVYQNILESNVGPSVQQLTLLKLGHSTGQLHCNCNC